MRLGKLFGGKGRLLACSTEERSKDTKLALRRDSRKLRRLRVSLGLEPVWYAWLGKTFRCEGSGHPVEMPTNLNCLLPVSTQAASLSRVLNMSHLG